MKSGDKIRVFKRTPKGHISGTVDFVVEEFRYCLGIFTSENDRKAGRFTPLCDLYEPGPESEERYIGNYGEYHTNMVQSWMDI